MLRLAIRAAAILFLMGAAAMTVWQPREWPVLIPPALIVLGTFYERRYTGVLAPSAETSGFRPTGERFVDPETGRITSVLTDPRTGARHYVGEEEPRSLGP